MTDYSFDLGNPEDRYDSGYQSQEQGFISKVFSWMFMGLLATGVVAFLVVSNPIIIKTLYSSPFMMIFLGIGTFALVWNLSANMHKMTPAAASANFFIYAGLNGVLLSSIFLVYTAQSIFSTFCVAAVTFGVTALYGATTKKDLTKLGSLLVMALFGLIIASVVNMFFHSTGLASLINYAGVLIFVGLTAYDMQAIKKIGQSYGYNPNFAVLGALKLYLDFINLFIYLLRILGDRRR
ncbi:MAG: Bax inhibitor-1/YccA family protein [Candidatus Caenarcaniphilales bacterium]|nr:Bax inhibitor-1/YccA family protein [Candidatus Caenarcaniphilales bacterium]